MPDFFTTEIQRRQRIFFVFPPCLCGESFCIHRFRFFDHCAEFGLYSGLEVGLDRVDLGKLGKGPAPIAAVPVYSGDLVGFHGGLLLLGVFSLVALDLDDEAEGSSGPRPSSTSTMKSGI